MLSKADIKLIRSLSGRTARRLSGLFVVEGTKSVNELLRSDFRVERLFATERCAAELETDRSETVSDSDLERISSQRTPQGCVAVAELPERRFRPDIFDGSLVLALDDVQDPGNVGTIVRTAAWFGVCDVICSQATADIFGPKAIQASMGTFLRVRVHYGDLPAMLSQAPKRGSQVFGTFLDGENIYSAQLPCTGVILLGNEGSGIGSEAAACVSRRLRIPAFAPEDAAVPVKPSLRMTCPLPSAQPTGAESLNVGAAAAIACSEFRRRLRR